MKRSTKKKLLKSGIVLSGLCALIAGFGDYITVRVIKYLYNTNVSVNEASSIGIIGGADGPTHIFLGTSISASNKPLWVMLFLVFMAIFLMLYRRVSKQN